MAHIKSRDIDQMNPEQRERRLADLKEELLQLRAQQAPVSYTHLTLPTKA